MELIFVALIILICVLLVAIILVQNPKGGGLSSSFGGGGTQLFSSVKKTTDFLDRGTWTLAIALVVLVLFANVMLLPQEGEEVQSSSLNNVEVQQTSVPQSINFDTETGDLSLPADQEATTEEE